MTVVVFDTNIFISAFHFGGTPRSVFMLAVSGLFQLSTSRFLLDELQRVLIEGFSYSAIDTAEIRQRLEEFCAIVEPTEHVTDCTDSDDNRVLECALAASARFIVTGDNSLLRLNPFRDIQILTAAQFLESQPWSLQSGKDK